MSRDILRNLKQAGIGIASGTYQIVGFPKLQVAISADRPDFNPSTAPLPS